MKHLNWKSIKSWELRGIKAILPDGSFWTIVQRNCAEGPDLEGGPYHGLKVLQTKILPCGYNLPLTGKYVETFDEAFEFIASEG